MDDKAFKEVLETIKSGTSFTARIDQHGSVQDLVGKVYVPKNDRSFFLCYDEGQDGAPSPDRLGYKYSWSITTRNMMTIEAIYFNTDTLIVNKEPQIINTYEIY